MSTRNKSIPVKELDKTPARINALVKRVYDPSVTCAWSESVCITPRVAQDLLNNTRRAEDAGIQIDKGDGVIIGFRQRPVNSKQVAKLRSSMRGGIFMNDTGETIKVSFVEIGDEWVLTCVDGQHRLIALIEEGLSYEVFLVLVRLEVFPYLDQHYARDARQIMETEEWGWPTICATMAKAYVAEDIDGYPYAPQRLGDSEIVEQCLPRKELFERVIERYQAAVKDCTKRDTAVHGPAQYYAIAKVVEATGDWEEMDAIMHYLRDPALHSPPNGSSLWANYANAIQGIVRDMKRDRGGKTAGGDVKFSYSNRQIGFHGFRYIYNLSKSAKARRRPPAQKTLEKTLTMLDPDDYEPVVVSGKAAA